MAKKFIVRGGNPLKGSVNPGGAKNASFKLMIAAALGVGESRLLNLAHIGDVEVTTKTLNVIGVKLTPCGERTVYMVGDGLKTPVIPKLAGEKTRSATLFGGLLLHKLGKAVLPLPGGCSLGERPIDRHLDGFRALGATVEYTKDGIVMRADKLVGATYRFPKKSHTGTEALLIAAAVAEGKTVIENAGQEPEIDDLIDFMNKMGARITRKPGDIIEVDGVAQLHGATHKVMPDRNEAVSYACMAYATKGDIIVENAQKEHLTAFLDKVEEIGGRYEVSPYGIRFWHEKPLVATDITTAPEPGFMTDWQPLWTTLMTQAEGTSHVIEAVHNNRLAFTSELNKMGARIKLYNPEVDDPASFYEFDHFDNDGNFHAAEITGPTKLKATHLMVPDLRGGATLTMAALIADGESVIEGIDHIDRGYEAFDRRLRELSAQIYRVE